MIPVCEPLLTGRELEYASDCLNTNWISSAGKYIPEFERRFAEYCGCKYGISTTSGTTALHLALASLGIGTGDEVIIPAFTMAACAFAVIYTGAKPVLVDAERHTWNIDTDQLEQRITKRTKAIMPVHIYGHPCDMGHIMDIAKRYNLFVVEDAAEAHGAEYKGTRVGGIGQAGCFSFYANKIITTGEGGMVVTNDAQLADKAKRLKDQAFAPQRRFLHTNIGFNYRMTNIQAAIGLAQIESIDRFVEMRRKNATLYNAGLKDIPGITLPQQREWAKNVHWMYGILADKELSITRDLLMQKLKEKGIDTRTFFIPMHVQPAFLDLGLFKGERYPVATELSEKGLYLPSGSGLKSEEIDYVCTCMRNIASGV